MKRIKLTYIFNREITSGKASLVQAVYMCDAFASTGVDVEMALPLSKPAREMFTLYAEPEKV